MNELRVDVYKVLQECIDEGINAGWNKAMKRIDGRIQDINAEAVIKEQIEHYILINICEKFKFD